MLSKKPNSAAISATEKRLLAEILLNRAILDRAREPIMRRLPDKAEQGLSCPFCLGAWIALGFWVAWIVWPHWTLMAATPFALSATVGLIAANLDPD